MLERQDLTVLTSSANSLIKPKISSRCNQRGRIPYIIITSRYYFCLSRPYTDLIFNYPFNLLGSIVSISMENGKSIDFYSLLKTTQLSEGTLALATDAWERREIYGTIFVQDKHSSVILDILKLNTTSAIDSSVANSPGAIFSSAEKYQLLCVLK